MGFWTKIPQVITGVKALSKTGAESVASWKSKAAKSKAVSGTDDAGLGVSHFKDYITKKAKPDVSIMPDDPHKFRWPNKGGGIAKRGMGAAFKKGGHVKSMGIAKRGGGVAKR